MKIGFLHSKGEFTGKLFVELKAKLSGHEVLEWMTGEDAPAADLELLIMAGKLTREQMAAQPKLVLVQTLSAGYEGLDVEAATDLGIYAAFSPSDETGNATSVAEFTVLLLLAASRRLPQALAATRDHGVTVPRLNLALSGKTVAIVGLGSIGRLLAERLHPFGVKLVATDGHPERAPEYVEVLAPTQIPEAIAEADYVVVAVRADKSNEDLFNAEMFAKMKRGAILVNVARGSLVDEQALADALRSGQLAGAALDVTRSEPIEEDNPLLGMEDVIITPHIAGFSDLSLAGILDYQVKTVEGVVRGELPGAVLNEPSRPRRALSSAPAEPAH